MTVYYAKHSKLSLHLGQQTHAHHIIHIYVYMVHIYTYIYICICKCNVYNMLLALPLWLCMINFERHCHDFSFNWVLAFPQPKPTSGSWLWSTRPVHLCKMEAGPLNHEACVTMWLIFQIQIDLNVDCECLCKRPVGQSLGCQGIDTFGGKAKEEQASLLRMQKFLVDHAGEVLKNIVPWSCKSWISVIENQDNLMVALLSL